MKKASELSNLFRPQKLTQEGVPGDPWQALNAWNAFLPPDRFGVGRAAAQPVPDAAAVPNLLALLLQGHNGAGPWGAPRAATDTTSRLAALLRQSAPCPRAPVGFKPMRTTLPKPLASPVVKAKPLPAAGCGHSPGWLVAGKPLNKGR